MGWVLVFFLRCSGPPKDISARRTELGKAGKENKGIFRVHQLLVGVKRGKACFYFVFKGVLIMQVHQIDISWRIFLSVIFQLPCLIRGYIQYMFGNGWLTDVHSTT